MPQPAQFTKSVLWQAVFNKLRSSWQSGSQYVELLFTHVGAYSHDVPTTGTDAAVWEYWVTKPKASEQNMTLKGLAAALTKSKQSFERLRLPAKELRLA